MAAHRKPTRLLELEGSLTKHRSRYAARANEPQPEGQLGPAPSYLSDKEKKVWREFRRIAFWLTDADRSLTEIACRLTAKTRSNEPMKASEYSMLLACLSKLGMTPTERSKIQAPPPKKNDVPEGSWAVFKKPEPKPQGKHNS